MARGRRWNTTWSSSAPAPAGLATAIRLKQLAAVQGKEISVVVLEKGQAGAHIPVRGDHGPPRAERTVPGLEGARRAAEPAGRRDKFSSSTRRARATPEFLLPDCFKNHGNYIISLGNLVRWMGQQAEALGSRSFPASPRRRCCTTTTARSRVSRPATWASPGRRADRQLPARHGTARQIHDLRRGGARGHLGKAAHRALRLDAGRDPQSYGIGIKELWEVAPDRHHPGLTVHTAGWPMDKTPTAELSLPHGGQPGRGRLRRRARLRQPWLSPVRGIPALEAPPGDQIADVRGRQAHRLRRTRNHRGRHPPRCQDRVPRRRAGRLRGRLPEREPHQGQPCGHQDRHARRRRRLRRRRRGPPARRARRLSRRLRAQLAARGARPRTQLQAVVQRDSGSRR